MRVFRYRQEIWNLCNSDPVTTKNISILSMHTSMVEDSICCVDSQRKLDNTC